MSPRFDLPRPRVHRARIGRIQGEIDDAGGVVDEQHLLPMCTTVDRAEYTALGVGRPLPTHCRDVHDVGIGGMDEHLADVMRVGQPHRRPRGAAIDRLEHAGARIRIARKSWLGLARAHPHDVRIAA